MRYKSYVVTYIGETKKVNNDNFFLNGFCKEDMDDPFIFERNKEFKSRNLYALTSGAKCHMGGCELAYVPVDILKNFYVADFDAINREFFHVANTAVTSQVLERRNEHYEVDMSILSIDRDYATVYNIGDIPVFCYENGKITNLAGTPPETVELAKDYLESNGEVKTKFYKVKNAPYIGTLSPDMDVVPYTSERKKIRRKTYFVMCSKDVMDAIDEKTIAEVLADKSVKDRNKALMMLDKAIKKEPEGNYTIEIIIATNGLAIAEKELKSLGKWLVIAGICVGACINSSFLISGLSAVVEGCKGVVNKYFRDEEVEGGAELEWTPMDAKDSEKSDSDGKGDESSDTVKNEKTDESAAKENEAENADVRQEESQTEDSDVQEDSRNNQAETNDEPAVTKTETNSTKQTNASGTSSAQKTQTSNTDKKATQSTTVKESVASSEKQTTPKTETVKEVKEQPTSVSSSEPVIPEPGTVVKTENSTSETVVPQQNNESSLQEQKSDSGVAQAENQLPISFD